MYTSVSLKLDRYYLNNLQKIKDEAVYSIWFATLQSF